MFPRLTASIASNIQYKDVIATAITNNGSIIPKNTDFFDSLDVQDVRIERVWVNIDDDCFSPKSNNTNLYVNTMYCNGAFDSDDMSFL